MHIPNREIYFPAVVWATEWKRVNWNRAEVWGPPTCESDDVTKDSKGVAKGDVEVLFPGAIRVPGIHKRKNGSERPWGESEQQSDRGVKPEGLGNTREILAKR